MKCKILAESSTRLRVHFFQHHMTYAQADMLEAYLRQENCVAKVKVSDRTCDAVIFVRGKGEAAARAKKNVLRSLAEFHYDDCDVEVPENSSRALGHEFEDKLLFEIAERVLNRFILPNPIANAITAVKSVRYIWRGLASVAKGKLDVPVLDATSIAASMLRGDFATAGTVMFLLGIGELMEDWTRKKSMTDLAQRMMLNVDQVWLKTADGEEILKPIDQVQVGDRVIVRTGTLIPLDGIVRKGEANVNQASMTGESLPVFKTEGGTVFAGTVVEDGEVEIEITKTQGSGRYDRIVRMIEESQSLKSETESKAYHLADSFVPYFLGATALTYLITGNVTKAMAILMVDFSCALKLSMPLTVMSAMGECSDHRIQVKGGNFLEAVAQAETIVFDKTGTLTYAQPRVAKIVNFSGRPDDDVLRLAACLEEHFPHSIANAVVKEAADRGLIHEEKHAKVEYIVAHGIASSLDGMRLCIGSYHFIFEDEKTEVPENQEEMFEEIPDEYSKLYMAVDRKLEAVLCIEDPIRQEAPEVVRLLHEAGFRNVVMMTGDSESAARAIGADAGVDQVFAEVLPEDKANFIRSEHEAGRKVVMVGDGINDSPALSEADAGVAIESGAAIAREAADITVSAGDLHELVVMRRIADAMMQRIHGSYRFIMGFNSSLILLGLLGIAAPATTATLHNMSTILIGIYSTTDLIGQED